MGVKSKFGEGQLEGALETLACIRRPVLRRHFDPIVDMARVDMASKTRVRQRCWINGCPIQIGRLASDLLISRA